MPDPKRKQAYDYQYTKDHYSRIAVLVPREWRADIDACARAVGLSVNAWVNRAIAAQIAAQNAPERPQNAAESAQASGTVDTSPGT